MRTDDPRRVEKLADESVRDETCILQLLVATEADLAARAHKPYDVLYAALDEGVTLHDVRPPGDRVAGPRRGEISASERLRDAGNWLEAAARRLSLTEDPTRFRDTVCEESSRSVRFGLKAVAVASGGCHHSQRNIAALRLEVERLGIDPCVDAALAAELDGLQELLLSRRGDRGGHLRAPSAGRALRRRARRGLDWHRSGGFGNADAGAGRRGTGREFARHYLRPLRHHVEIADARARGDAAACGWPGDQGRAVARVGPSEKPVPEGELRAHAVVLAVEQVPRTRNARAERKVIW